MSKAAYGAYTYAINVKPVGKMGVATLKDGAISVPASIVGLDKCTDPRVFYYKNYENNDRILLFETKYENYVATDGQISAYDSDLNQKISGFKATKKLVNLYALTGKVKIGENSYMYGIDYDQHKVVRFQVGINDSLATDAEWAAFKAKEGSLGYGVDVVTDGKYVYALFVSATKLAQGEYDFYSIVRLDLDLTNPVELKVDGEKNPFSLDLYKGELYVTVLGGMQKYGSTNGAASKIQKVATEGFSATSAVKTLLVGGDSADLGDFRAISFTTAGDAYVLTGCLDSDAAAFTGALYHTTVSALVSTDPDEDTIKTISVGSAVSFTKVKGYTWGLFYSEAEGILWASKGNDLETYKYSADDKKIVVVAGKTIADLAGSAYNLNTVALLEACGNLKGYAAPAFASVSKAALLEREKLLKK